MMISPRLSQVFRTSTGNKFHGLLSDPEDRFEGDRVQARRILRVASKILLANGEIVSDGRESYLLVYHSTDRYLAFMINDWLPWTRMEKVVDPVSGMERGGVETILDTRKPVVLEPATVIQEKGLERVRYKIRAGGDFRVGDKLGEYVVHSVQKVGGASIMEAY